jgi:hypothetical protein
MSRQPSNSQSKPARRVKPVLEGLEGRQLLSSGPAVGASPATALGLSHENRQFAYKTPTGGTAFIVIQGQGNLIGTYVDGMGLHIEYADTNSFSKIIGDVHGGDGRAPLVSILNRHLVDANAQNSLSGVGGNVLQAVILNDWDLVAGGTINLTSGVNSLVLNSIGPDTEVHLRNIPASLLPTALVANALAVSQSSTSSSSSSSSAAGSSSGRFGSSSSSSSSSGVTPTLPGGVPTTIANSNGTSWTYILEKKQDLTLTGVSGRFTAGTNVVESLPTGQPRQTQPPAPPGIILKVNAIYGAPTQPINLLTDPVIWAYNAQTHKLLQFRLNLTTSPDFIGVPDGISLSVPGDPKVVGLNLGRNGNQLDVLVSSGTIVYAYNATTGKPDLTNGSTGSFNTAALLGPGPIVSIGSTDTVTVLSSDSSNSLVMIDLAASLQAGKAQPAAGSPAPFTPNPLEFTLLGGLTGLPGSNTIYGTVAAHFNTLQPDMLQLGFQPANTVLVTHDKVKGSKLNYRFTGGTPIPYTTLGNTVNVISGQTGTAMGSLDSNLAVNFNPPQVVDKNTIALVNPSTGAQIGKIKLKDPRDATLKKPYPVPLAAISSAFRPDLNGSASSGTGPTSSGTGPALIDIQGDVQSVRGRKAIGMILNDSGNLNLVKFAMITNSTIVGQPVGHIDVNTHLVNVTLLTPSRTVDGRGGVSVVRNLQQIGPLSLTGD